MQIKTLVDSAPLEYASKGAKHKTDSTKMTTEV